MAGITAVLSPSSDDATKSRPPALFSDTARFTVKSVAAAALRLTVNTAAVPSVTGLVPASTVTVGSSLRMRTR